MNPTSADGVTPPNNPQASPDVTEEDKTLVDKFWEGGTHGYATRKDAERAVSAHRQAAVARELAASAREVERLTANLLDYREAFSEIKANGKSVSQVTMSMESVRACREEFSSIRAENAKLRAELAGAIVALKEAVDMAESLAQTMDYLGTGSDSRLAAKEQEADEKKIADFRTIIAALNPQPGAKG